MVQAHTPAAQRIENEEPHGALEPDAPLVLIAEARPMLRHLLQGFVESSAGMRVMSTPSLRDWLRTDQPEVPDVLLLSVPDGARLPRSLSELAIPAHDPLASVPIVVQSNERSSQEIVDLIRIGIRGFIPTSISIRIAVQALHLVSAGGTFVPSSFLCSLPDNAQKAAEGQGFLTGRQLQVVEAIRQGKPNKTIAYELNMCESTVKVHVRAIMKKLKARNRTEVAYLFSSQVTGSEAVETH